ncbi:MAG: CoA-binding protein [Bacteroidia bacterium]
MKKTLVMGASVNPERYAFQATALLNEHHHQVVPFGIKDGEINGIKILTQLPDEKDFDTVTMYLGKEKQKNYYNYILALHPKRVVFNPGSENFEFEKMLVENGIQPVEACTLVLLRTGRY